MDDIIYLKPPTVFSFFWHHRKNVQVRKRSSALLRHERVDASVRRRRRCAWRAHRSRPRDEIGWIVSRLHRCTRPPLGARNRVHNPSAQLARAVQLTLASCSCARRRGGQHWGKGQHQPSRAWLPDATTLRRSTDARAISSQAREGAGHARPSVLRRRTLPV